MNLNPAIGGSGGNRWCGPAAIAILTGLSTGEAAARLRAATGQAYIKGAQPFAVLGVLQAAGYTTVQMTPSEWRFAHGRNRRPSVERWAVDADRDVYLVETSSHWLVLDTRSQEACDNHTIYPLALARYKFRRTKVTTAWRIKKTAPVRRDMR